MGDVRMEACITDSKEEKDFLEMSDWGKDLLASLSAECGDRPGLVNRLRHGAKPPEEK